MPTAVITGCDSGIGHAFAKILIGEGYEVHACDLNAGPALQSLQCRLHILDLRSPDSINALATQLASKPIDILLNVAGVMSPHASDAFETTTQAILTRTFETNTFGPLLLSQALLPNLLLAAKEAANTGGTVKVGIVSSRVGSIGDNLSGGSYAYRASKAAVNSIGKSMAVDLHERGVVVTLLHPGIVNSGLTAGMDPAEGAVEPDEAAGKLWTVFSEKGMDATGRFWNREGVELPW